MEAEEEEAVWGLGRAQAACPKTLRTRFTCRPPARPDRRVSMPSIPQPTAELDSGRKNLPLQFTQTTAAQVLTAAHVVADSKYLQASLLCYS